MTANDHMRRAIRLAEENAASGNGGPFGAVIVKDGKVVAEGSNTVTVDNDPTQRHTPGMCRTGDV